MRRDERTHMAPAYLRQQFFLEDVHDTKEMTCSARALQVHAATSLRACVASIAPSSAFSVSVRMPFARSSASSGTTRKALWSFKISRRDGKSEATIGRPAAMYANILRGDVEILEISCFPEFGTTSISAAFI